MSLFYGYDPQDDVYVKKADKRHILSVAWHYEGIKGVSESDGVPLGSGVGRPFVMVPITRSTTLRLLSHTFDGTDGPVSFSGSDSFISFTLEYVSPGSSGRVSMGFQPGEYGVIEKLPSPNVYVKVLNVDVDVGGLLSEVGDGSNNTPDPYAGYIRVLYGKYNGQSGNGNRSCLTVAVYDV